MIILFTSELFMIMIIHHMPFQTFKINKIEAMNEIVMILFVYHIILLSDMYPITELDFKKGVSISMIILMLICLFAFIYSLLSPLVFSIYKKVKSKILLRHRIQRNNYLNKIKQPSMKRRQRWNKRLRRKSSRKNRPN